MKTFHVHLKNGRRQSVLADRHRLIAGRHVFDRGSQKGLFPFKEKEVSEIRDAPPPMKQRYYSNIYWHFTGSPRLKDEQRPICKMPEETLFFAQPRSPERALATLFRILKSHTLKATCSEQISEALRTQKFCCVTDIPLMDLALHAQYYGQVALGFNWARIHQRFTPVFYIPRWRLPRKNHNPKGILAAEDIIDDRRIDPSLAAHLKITNFSPRSGESFYQEREWRCLENFWFEGKDVEAVIVPKDLKKKAQEFLLCPNNEEFAGVPVLTWDFLEQA